MWTRRLVIVNMLLTPIFLRHVPRWDPIEPYRKTNFLIKEIGPSQQEKNNQVNERVQPQENKTNSPLLCWWKNKKFRLKKTFF